jgi:hypothetical protein
MLQLESTRVSNQRLLALAVVLITLMGSWPHVGSMWAIVIVDGVALVLIYFPDTIDDLTFGTFSRGGQIDSHTPPWMISSIGWLLMFLMAGVVLRRR